MNLIKYRFTLVYLMFFTLSILIGYSVNLAGINNELTNYYDFVGDILNFTAILTGFIGAIISILTSISKSSPIITSILRSKKALSEFVISMAVPFTTGLITIFISMLFRLKIYNPDLFFSFKHINITLLSLVIFFVITSFLMTFFVFYIFFLDGFSNKNKKSKNKYVPRLKE